MEELFPKVIEYGVLGFLCCYLVMKGVAAIQALTKVIEKLTETVNNLQIESATTASKLNSIENRLSHIEHLLHSYYLPPESPKYRQKALAN